MVEWSMDNESDRTCEQAAVTQLGLLFQHLSGETQEAHSSPNWRQTVSGPTFELAPSVVRCNKESATCLTASVPPTNGQLHVAERRRRVRVWTGVTWLPCVHQARHLPTEQRNGCMYASVFLLVLHHIHLYPALVLRLSCVSEKVGVYYRNVNQNWYSHHK